MISKRIDWESIYRESPGSRQYHLKDLELISKREHVYFSGSGPTSKKTTLDWLHIALLHGHAGAITVLLDHLDVPHETLTLKQRIALYQLNSHEESV